MHHGFNIDPAIIPNKAGPVLGCCQLLHCHKQLLPLEGCIHVGHLSSFLESCPLLKEAVCFDCLLLNFLEEHVALIHVSALHLLHLQGMREQLVANVF